jgi:pyridoxine 4-dehydrogenase
LWDYDPSQDEEIYRAYRAIRDAGVTIFDTADSYGTMELNGRAEILLGQFERRYQAEIMAGSKSNMFDLGSLLTGNSDYAKKSNKQQVATKFAPYPWRITRDSLVQAARESLKRLDQDSKLVWERLLFISC